MLLKYHYKLRHAGFEKLKNILRNFKVFGSKGKFSSEGEIPKCSSCIVGGIEKRPIQGKPKMDAATQKRILKEGATVTWSASVY